MKATLLLGRTPNVLATRLAIRSGIVDSVSAHYIGQYITSIVLLGAAALTILVRPRGLLGR